MAAAFASQSSRRAESAPWDAVAVARAHLNNSAGARGLATAADDAQEIVSTRQSAGAVHVRFQQTKHGVPIDGAISTVSMRSGDKAARFSVDRSVPGSAAPSPQANVSVSDAEATARSAIAAPPGASFESVRTRLVYAQDGRRLALAWEVRGFQIRPAADWKVMVDAHNGRVISKVDLIDYDSGLVFASNPYQQSGGTIPPPTNCDSGANATTLASQRSSVTLLGIQAGQNKLKGQYVDMTAPGVPGAYKVAGTANEVTRIYNYGCNDDRFEEVMVYHHVDRTQRKLQALGFTGGSSVLNRPISAHAHYSAGCNAFYSEYDNALHFFDGDGVSCFADFGEDGDVIVHEYGHAIQDDVVPGWAGAAPLASEQARAMGEGFGDFVAGAMNGDACVGGWAYNEVFPGSNKCLRTMETPETYPGSFEACPDTPEGTEEEHCGGLLWGGALWDLAQALGDNQAARELVLQLAVDAHFYLSPTATFNDAAAAIRQADLDLYGGAHVATINTVMAARGLSTGVATNYPYLYFRVQHAFPGDLVVGLKVGSISSPTCGGNIINNNYGWVVFWFQISAGTCGNLLPPSVTNPWYLEVRDSIAGDAGVLLEYEIALSDSRRCISASVPLVIPGNNSSVYAVITCSNIVGPQATITNSPTPTPTATTTPTATATSTPTPDNDTDDDGVANSSDNCPGVANADQLNTDAAPLSNAPAVNDITVPMSDTLGDACDADGDNDTIADADEAAGCNGSGPLSALLADTDGDRTRDGAECMMGTDPASSASKPLAISPGESDNDGLSDALEAILGTNPADADTDDDGIGDGIEFRGYSTSPLTAASDGDSCADDTEVASLNGDKVVTATDLLLVATHFNSTTLPNFDATKDGVVNSIDLLIVATNFKATPC